MFWVLLCAALAVTALAVVACYAVWLAHKLSDLWSEIRVLTERGAGVLELLGQVGKHSATAGDTSGEYRRTAGAVAQGSTYDESASARPASEKRKL